MEDDRPRPRLSPREAELLALASEGLTDAGIAHRLGISEATVGTYWGRVRIKLGPYSRTELVAITLHAESDEAIKELQATNRALVEQLKAARSDDQPIPFHEVLDKVADAIIVVSRSSKIAYANNVAEEMFGYPRGGLAGLPLEALVPEPNRDKHAVEHKEYMESPSQRNMGDHVGTAALRKDGSVFSIHASLAPVLNKDQPFFVCTIQRESLPRAGRYRVMGRTDA